MKTKEPNPPKIALWIIKQLSINYHQTMALGDLEEIFYQIYDDSGKNKANQWYWRQSLK